MDIIDKIRDEIYRAQDHRINALAMHPDTLRRVKEWAERTVTEWKRDHGEKYHEAGREPDPKAPRIEGWPVMEFRDVPRGEVRFVEVIDIPEPTEPSDE